jgi:hypothetical protein
VRWCIAGGGAWFQHYIAEVTKARGEEAARRLREDVRLQAALGNTGAPGSWIRAKQEELTT